MKNLTISYWRNMNHLGTRVGLMMLFVICIVGTIYGANRIMTDYSPNTGYAIFFPSLIVGISLLVAGLIRATKYRGSEMIGTITLVIVLVLIAAFGFTAILG